jgi:hypothetical protein
MPYTKYLLRRNASFLISKFYFRFIKKLPFFLSGTLIIWFNLQYYKKIKVLIFIFLSILTRVKPGVSKRMLKYFFYTSLDLGLIFNFIHIYLCNVDIEINTLLLRKGKNTIGVFFSYNKMPIISELDILFEGITSLMENLQEITLSVKCYLRANTLLITETFLRILKIPILLSK